MPFVANSESIFDLIHSAQHYPRRFSSHDLQNLLPIETKQETIQLLFERSEKLAVLERLQKISSALAIEALIALRNQAWKEWIRNSLVCFSICELEIRCSYAGLKS
uniref:Maturase K n=1 Tax=Panagrolaimus sp. JU765 TaxID=591449 RepID=A0AC34Q8U7_9BILA